MPEPSYPLARELDEATERMNALVNRISDPSPREELMEPENVTATKMSPAVNEALITVGIEELDAAIAYLRNAAVGVAAPHIHLNLHGMPRHVFDLLPGEEHQVERSPEEGGTFWSKHYPTSNRSLLCQFFCNEAPE